MKRRLAAALLIVTLPLGMAACHGTKSRKATPSTPAPAATASADPTQAPGPTQAPAATQAPGNSSQSVDQACGLITDQMKTFTTSFDSVNDEVKQKAIVDTTIETLNSPKITNPEVKQASSNVATVLTDILAYGKKYESNPSAADQNEANELIARLGTSLLSLNDLCPGIVEK
ncbi:endo alpha-1,4 polygalactosaminidase [Schaalia odontolytica]|uniref:Endo alpha-1,4 polygalactosaminidase n=1 Tax=Schaalia odontolytica TaxID=1660 RepID=A0A0V8RYR6_9ACTO|nr:hypothetical protein [Schaalia odontolytica]KSW13185.1 endo alpha-1,4 polygalactosaminidase [Schaalia odontolytica]QCT36298.1 endo alpha-1,4 polygalactosaminidase [Schaalia odontolytica]